MMSSIKVLDCTLRDGGCVNDFSFGSEYINRIHKGLQQARVDAIECGYIDEKKGSEEGRTQYIDEESMMRSLTNTRDKNIEYFAMIDYGKYDPIRLPQRSTETIDGIRFAFHKEQAELALKAAEIILKKGYDLFMQPMITIRYSDEELISLINKINTFLPETKAFYIVDSFGEMREDDIERLVYLVDHNLKKNISLGFHSHNNLQLSYSNALKIIHLGLKRNIYIDSSVLGMGKGAGNLNTELLLEHLNINYDGKYDVAPLLDVIDEVLNQIYQETPWGYSIEYYLSSINHCTPSYAGYFYRKHTLSVKQVSELLGMIEPEKKISFDQEYAEELFLKYNKDSIEDENVINMLKDSIKEKEVVLIAPGKSIIEYKNEINAYVKEMFSVALNCDTDFETEYTIITKSLSDIEKIIKKHKTIVSSNVRIENITESVINFSKWIDEESEYGDAAVVIAVKLLKECGVKKIFLAGFDGFKPSINENYFNKEYRRPMSEKQVSGRNEYIKTFLKKMSKEIEFVFITPSYYNEK